MTKNTHLAAGVAISTAILMPHDIQSLTMCICGAAIGSTISDIDVASSKPRKELNTIVGISIAVITVLIVLEYSFNIGIYSLIESEPSAYRAFLGFTLFLFLSLYGSTTAHRSFTHSLVGLITFTGAAWFICPFMAPPFCIGMISHIVLDMLNAKKVQLLYPYKKFGIALKLCRSDGNVNASINIVSTLILIVELVVFAILHVCSSR